MIKTQNLSFVYRETDENDNTVIEGKVLKEINLTIEKGSFTAVLGCNGSGKSTLAKHFNAILLPTGGKVYIKGMDTSDKKEVFNIRQSAGMVFQNPDNQIVTTVVEEDVGFGPENLGVPTEEILRRVHDALEAVDMLDYAKSAPHMLSGGQKQRIAIAGMLAIEPQVLVLDEATAMLDPLGRKDILRIVKDLNRKKGITVIMITQYMEEAVIADRVIVMNEGLVAFEGTPAEVFRRGTELRKINLDVPPMVELRDDLAASGIIKPCNAMTVEEMANELCPLLLKI